MIFVIIDACESHYSFKTISRISQRIYFELHFASGKTIRNRSYLIATFLWGANELQHYAYDRFETGKKQLSFTAFCVHRFTHSPFYDCNCSCTKITINNDDVSSQFTHPFILYDRMGFQCFTFCGSYTTLYLHPKQSFVKSDYLYVFVYLALSLALALVLEFFQVVTDAMQMQMTMNIMDNLRIQTRVSNRILMRSNRLLPFHLISEHYRSKCPAKIIRHFSEDLPVFVSIFCNGIQLMYHMSKIRLRHSLNKSIGIGENSISRRQSYRTDHCR